MIRFLVDAQLPPALARWLTDRGFEAEHVADRGLATAADMAIWVVAHDLGATIITKDQDFAQLRTRSVEGPAVIWIRLSNTRRNELLAWFEQILPAVVSSLQNGETLVEISSHVLNATRP